MIVNGYKLPPLLIKLMLEDQWKLPNNTTVLKEITRVSNPQYFNFLNHERMIRETNSAMLLFKQGYGSIYNLDSSKEKGHDIRDLAVLDIDKSVMIIVNDDEEAVFLDYRNNEQEPRVVYQNLEGQWEEIASSFTVFINKIGL